MEFWIGWEKLLHMIDRMRYGWNFLRWLRFSIGIFILIEGIISGIGMFILLGVIFTLMPLLNIGCCSTSACGTNQSKFNDDENGDFKVVYEEINTKKELK